MSRYDDNRRDDTRGGGGGGGGGSGGGYQGGRQGDGCRIYVGNLPNDVREGELEDLFYKYGRIRDIQIKGGRGGPCFAFLEFSDARDADDAIYGRDRYRFGGRALRVERPRSGANTDRGRRDGDGGSGSSGRGGRDGGGGGRDGGGSPSRAGLSQGSTGMTSISPSQMQLGLQWSKELEARIAYSYEQCITFLGQGSALDESVFLAWFDEHKGDGEWLKEQDRDGRTPLHRALQYAYALPAVTLALLAACPEAAKIKNIYDRTPLHIALQKKSIPTTVVLALLAACPEAAKMTGELRNTLLHVVLNNKDIEPVVSAIFAAYPGAVKQKNAYDLTPLDYNILPGIPAEVVAEYRRNLPDNGAVCMSYFREGRHLNVDTFLVWLDAHKGNVFKKSAAHKASCEWLKVTDEEDHTLLHNALMNKGIPAAVPLAILAACPGAAKMTDECGNTPLRIALRDKDIPAALTLAMLAACPEAAKVTDSDGHGYGITPLCDALQNKDTTEPVVSALFAAYPETVNKRNEDDLTPLDYGILPGIPAEVVAEYRRKLPDARAVCMSYLREGKYLNVGTFLAWLDAHKGDGNFWGLPIEWLKVTDERLTDGMECIEAGYTPLHHALEKKDIPAAVALALLAACPEVAKMKNLTDSTPLNVAVYQNASVPVVAALIAVWPGAIKEVDCNGGTPLHTLATAVCSTLAERRRTNTLCFMLVKHRASLVATNTKGQTPAAVAAPSDHWEARTSNQHLIATLREIALFKKHTHLSWMHFRDWTTVSHAWCTPSAKLVAVTVLLVGETYKRGLLPRLPMDCWYRILNKLPRHELRLSECEPAEEQAVLATYTAILKEARTAVDASDAAAVARTAVAHA